ncbi:MAG: GDP-mannose 4,6-dehydratase [Candidatus Omnitrophica bacterium]|nr:GDP-mannose 4,6-dehydratase [Candidatus Omnitrophota bacterium]
MKRPRIKKALVTGIAGFVGLHLAEALLRRGFRVRGLDNFMCSRREGLRPLLGDIEFIEGDVRDRRHVRRAVDGVDAVFHLAAIRSVVKTVEDPLVAHEVNATGALLLLDGAMKAGVKHFIFTSTSAVYGEARAPRQRESGKTLPISPYGIAKAAAEEYLRYYFRQTGFPSTAVRIFNVYGPRQNPESKYSLVIPGMLSRILAGQRPVIEGGGRQSRDFVYIGDILEAFFRILGNPAAYGKVYNLGSGRTTSINDIAGALLRLSGSRLRPLRAPRRPGDPKRTCADISLIRKELGWTPKVSLEKGLKEVIGWATRSKKEGSC